MAVAVASTTPQPINGTGLTGREYEILLGSELSRRCGGAVTDTTAERGALDRAVGDFVIRGRFGSRAVVEAKNRPLSHAESMAELDAALENREAQAAVLVFASQAQAGGTRLRVCPGNRILAVWHPHEGDGVALDAALQVARCLAASTREHALERAMLANQVSRLRHRLELVRAALG